MPINADKPHLWKNDIQASVDLFNAWFMRFAPKAYRDTRIKTTKHVEETLLHSQDLLDIAPTLLMKHPEILPTLRMSCCPPIARDRLIGLAGVSKSLVGCMEAGELPPRMADAILQENLKRISGILTQMFDIDICPWLVAKQRPSKQDRRRASTIIADRLCGAMSDPIIRNAQEKRQLAYIGTYLKKKGYVQKPHPPGKLLNEMERGTFAFRMNVVVGSELKVNIPIDVVIQPKKPRASFIPILMEAKSAGDFTNVNKRRKEEATKMHQLKATYGPHVEYILFLCGYFDSGYLGYEAAEGIDWIWEHRIEDFENLGV
jgi:XamI-like restriction endonuclease